MLIRCRYLGVGRRAAIWQPHLSGNDELLFFSYLESPLCCLAELPKNALEVTSAYGASYRPRTGRGGKGLGGWVNPMPGLVGAICR